MAASLSDTDLLAVPLEIDDIWEDFVLEDFEPENALSSHELGDNSPGPDLSGPASNSPAPQITTAIRKKKTRGRRREEIAELRAQVSSLEEKLDALRLQDQIKSHAARSLVVWESRAKCELSARRIAEEKNQRLRVTLAQQVKIAQRLVRLIAKVGSPRGRFLRTRSPSASDSDCSDTVPEVPFSVCDDPLSNTISIDMHSKWTFTDETVLNIAAALWMRYCTTRVNLSRFVIEYEKVSSDDNNIQAFYTISCDGEVAFEGSQLVQQSHNDLTGQTEITEYSQTLPREKGIDAILDITMFKCQTTSRVSPTDSMGVTMVHVERKFQIQTGQANPLRRRAVAEAVTQHFKEEIQWIHREVQNALTLKDAHVAALHTPPRDDEVSSIKKQSVVDTQIPCFEARGMLMY